MHTINGLGLIMLFYCLIQAGAYPQPMIMEHASQARSLSKPRNLKARQFHSSSGLGSSSKDSKLSLNDNLVQTASGSTGQGANSEAGQAASDVSDDNFINLCDGKTLTNGDQVQGGSCNGVVMGEIPSKSKMVSTIITNPATGANIDANQDFQVVMQIANLATGSFTNPDSTYYSAPQSVDQNGLVVGHTHVTIQDMGVSLNPTQPLDASKFVFFKGINDAAVNGKLATTVTGGLPAGFYRVCTMSSASNHQSVLMPVAQRGAQDDCSKFTVGAKQATNQQSQAQTLQKNARVNLASTAALRSSPGQPNSLTAGNTNIFTALPSRILGALGSVFKRRPAEDTSENPALLLLNSFSPVDTSEPVETNGFRALATTLKSTTAYPHASLSTATRVSVSVTQATGAERVLMHTGTNTLVSEPSGTNVDAANISSPGTSVDPEVVIGQIQQLLEVLKSSNALDQNVVLTSADTGALTTRIKALARSATTDDNLLKNRIELQYPKGVSGRLLSSPERPSTSSDPQDAVFSLVRRQATFAGESQRSVDAQPLVLTDRSQKSINTLLAELGSLLGTTTTTEQNDSNDGASNSSQGNVKNIATSDIVGTNQQIDSDSLPEATVNNDQLSKSDLSHAKTSKTSTGDGMIGFTRVDNTGVSIPQLPPTNSLVGIASNIADVGSVGNSRILGGLGNLLTTLLG